MRWKANPLFFFFFLVVVFGCARSFSFPSLGIILARPDMCHVFVCCCPIIRGDLRGTAVAAHFVTTARVVTLVTKCVKFDTLPSRFVTPARFVTTW